VALIISIIACMVVTAIVSVWLTTMVSVATKNQLMQRRTRQLQYWQNRAMRAEDPEYRQ
jgi:hypothetical protein